MLEMVERYKPMSSMTSSRKFEVRELCPPPEVDTLSIWIHIPVFTSRRRYPRTSN